MLSEPASPLGSAWGYGWGDCDWHGGKVKINVDRNVHYNSHINRESYRRNVNVDRSGRGDWQHDVNHRKGVSYRDNGTAQKFNRGTDAQAARSREDFRGRAEGGRQDLARSGTQAASARDRDGNVSNRSGAGDRGGAGERASGARALQRIERAQAGAVGAGAAKHSKASAKAAKCATPALEALRVVRGAVVDPKEKAAGAPAAAGTDEVSWRGRADD